MGVSRASHVTSVTITLLPVGESWVEETWQNLKLFSCSYQRLTEDIGTMWVKRPAFREFNTVDWRISALAGIL